MTLSDYFDAPTIGMMRAVLEEAWSSLDSPARGVLKKTDLATCILVAAGNGERDPAKLRLIALRWLLDKKSGETKSPMI